MKDLIGLVPLIGMWATTMLFMIFSSSDKVSWIDIAFFQFCFIVGSVIGVFIH